MARLPYLSSRLQGYQSTIFAEMSALAVRTGAINLGQGFPDTDGPTEVLEAAVAAIRSGTANQYPPGIGIPELRHAVARHQKRFWGMDVDPDSEVLITAGASEALAASILALTEVGDDVLTFEPWYDLYGAVISMAGAVRKVVTLRPPDYGFEPDELAGRDAAHPNAGAQQPAQSDRQGVQPGRAGSHCGSGRRARPDRGHRRGLRAPDLRR